YLYSSYLYLHSLFLHFALPIFPSIGIYTSSYSFCSSISCRKRVLFKFINRESLMQTFFPSTTLVPFFFSFFFLFSFYSFLFPFRSEEHTSELQSRENLLCRLLL